MSISFQRFLVIEVLGIAAFNAAINVAYTWGLWRSVDPITLFGENGIGGDLATTPSFIGLLSTLFGTHGLRRKLEDGRVAVASAIRMPGMMRLLPMNVPVRAATIGLLCEAALGLPLSLLLASAQFGVMSLAEACSAKAAITVLLSFVIVPITILCALGDVQRRSGQGFLKA
jgi:hypothetical protein